MVLFPSFNRLIGSRFCSLCDVYTSPVFDGSVCVCVLRKRDASYLTDSAAIDSKTLTAMEAKVCRSCDQLASRHRCIADRSNGRHSLTLREQRIPNHVNTQLKLRSFGQYDRRSLGFVIVKQIEASEESPTFVVLLAVKKSRFLLVCERSNNLSLPSNLSINRAT